MRLFGIVGYKNSGKTGLVERLVIELTGRGLRVSTLKHAHHAFDVDQPGRDSHRHRDAGARQVLVASDRRWALMSELGDAPEPTLDELLERLDPVDVVLAEGWKTAPIPKIEAWREAAGNPLLAPDDSTVRAVASDVEVTVPCPRFPLDDASAIADFILSEPA
ncbi:molybdopterin-guanine dinucleotide biosynthesis protein B [Pelagovum pacificum]|uniref:Molybdopterin-guanine dinucleotide biosynthesis protein B n=1 Tax=Pelagovum pacificum TaxID=2588711 RepID=A0A5C5GG09_9RHOB|nr:molybdopterin-guanine dinucleotide biosynthesis protein B [Pelagovum pacificum]QQA43217.1 molybdopterin-guanine dinucleotide biosynthesis protein B [Pelagovum pacificum]TNY33643.1 molybdopterin-guanine dinucleotide biosynthesis protein B [Pelagovum pacificum]